MTKKNTYYFIDFENVHEKGLEGISSLDAKDHVHLFFTPKSHNIKLESLIGLKADLTIHETATGNQSLDKHLVSYLGYMLGKENPKTSDFVIISEDKGYDRLITFWEKEEGIEISRRTKFIEKVQPAVKAEKKKSTKTKQPAKQKAAEPKKKEPSPKTKLNAAIQKTVRDAGYESEVINSIASAVSKLYDQKDIHEKVRELIGRDYPQAAEIVDSISKTIEEETGVKIPAKKKTGRKTGKITVRRISRKSAGKKQTAEGE